MIDLDYFVSLSKERICEELTKAIDESPNPANYFKLLTESKVIYRVFPEIEGMETLHHDNRGSHYGESIYQHTLDVMERYPRDNVDFDIKHFLAIIFHDIGKLHVKPESDHKDGVVHFIGHEELSATIANTRLTALRFPSKVISYVVTMATHHMTMNQITDSKHPRRSMTKLFVFSLHSNFDSLYDLIYLSMADQNKDLRHLCGDIASEFGQERLITGKDVMKYPDKLRGKILDQMFFIQLSQRLDYKGLKRILGGEVKNIMENENK